MACAGAVLAVLIARAAVDCGVWHPDGCDHRTTLGTEPCDTGGAVCEGASQTNCVTMTGKTVISFPKDVEDAHTTGSCTVGSITNIVDGYTGHHYITATNQNCSQVFGCKWDGTPPGKCEPDPNTFQNWHQAPYKTSNACYTRYNK